MIRLAFVLSLSLANAAFAKLEVRNIQPCQGALGPARASDDVFPHDEYVVRYQLAGVKADKDGKADLEVAIRLTNPDGKTVLDRKTNVQRQLSLGGDSLQTAGSITFPDKLAAGAYTLSVVVRDKIAGETASFERKLTAKATEFQILSPRFFADEEAKVPTGLTHVAGEMLYFKLNVYGFDKSSKRVGLVMRATVVDSEGKDIGAKPLVVNGDVTDPDKVAKSTVARFNGTTVLHRAGDFRLRIAVEDTVAKKTITFEAPLKVLAP